SSYYRKPVRDREAPSRGALTQLLLRRSPRRTKRSTVGRVGYIVPQLDHPGTDPVLLTNNVPGPLRLLHAPAPDTHLPYPAAIKRHTNQRIATLRPRTEDC